MDMLTQNPMHETHLEHEDRSEYNMGIQEIN